MTFRLDWEMTFRLDWEMTFRLDWEMTFRLDWEMTFCPVLSCPGTRFLLSLGLRD